jgi:beta-aspartyl-peptidase (threonine type)
MNKALIFSLFFLVGCSTNSPREESTNSVQGDSPTIDNQIPSTNGVAIVIHGGAGAIKKENMLDSLENVYLTFLDSVVSYGYELLEKGEEGEQVVINVIELLENSPLFNAGKGAVFTNDGRNELDASIMHGKTLNAGAVAGVTTVKNPIKLAREVMNNSEHVLLTGNGAESFADLRGIEKVDPAYFYVQSRMDALKRIQEKEHQVKESKFGTVGCVVLDKQGDIVAGTSTGGMTNKKWGRVGDSPIIGAGTYANNATCGVSSTGWGEFFIRNIVAYDIAAMMDYAGLTLEEAAAKVIHEKLQNLGGDGGIIALDRKGNVSMVFNTAGMFRGAIDGKGKKTVAIYD